MWLKITLDQQYCITKTSHKWDVYEEKPKENVYTCDKSDTCTCTGTICDKSTVKVSREWRVPEEKAAESVTGCRWGNSIMLRVSNGNFDPDVDHEINMYTKSGKTSVCVFTSIFNFDNFRYPSIVLSMAEY